MSIANYTKTKEVILHNDTGSLSRSKDSLTVTNDSHHSDCRLRAKYDIKGKMVQGKAIHDQALWLELLIETSNQSTSKHHHLLSIVARAFSDPLIICNYIDYIPLRQYGIGTLRDNHRIRLSMFWINCAWKISIGNNALVVWPSGYVYARLLMSVEHLLVNDRMCFEWGCVRWKAPCWKGCSWFFKLTWLALKLTWLELNSLIL